MKPASNDLVRFLPEEPEAREAIEAFLAEKGWTGGYGMEPQYANDPEDSVWAFWGDTRPYTSYLHADGTVESYGI